MDVKISEPKPIVAIRRQNSEKDRIRVTKKTLQAMLNQCQRTLESPNSSSVLDNDEECFGGEGGATVANEERRLEDSPSVGDDREADKLCDLLRSGFECPTFLEKLEFAQASISLNTTENSWDIVGENDLWEGADIVSDQDDYVLVRQEDIADGIACFMAAYMLSLGEIKDLTPNQLQEALRKTFSMKKKKGKLQKAWAGSKVIYDVASWGATAIGIYQNPVILSAATKTFWTSCHVISKLL